MAKPLNGNIKWIISTAIIVAVLLAGLVKSHTSVEKQAEFNAKEIVEVKEDVKEIKTDVKEILKKL